nr:hypothetical protein CFP56_48767 [Quercus suber]
MADPRVLHFDQILFLAYFVQDDVHEFKWTVWLLDHICLRFDIPWRFHLVAGGALHPPGRRSLGLIDIYTSTPEHGNLSKSSLDRSKEYSLEARPGSSQYRVKNEPGKNNGLDPRPTRADPRQRHITVLSTAGTSRGRRRRRPAHVRGDDHVCSETRRRVFRVADRGSAIEGAEDAGAGAGIAGCGACVAGVADSHGVAFAADGEDAGDRGGGEGGGRARGGAEVVY